MYSLFIDTHYLDVIVALYKDNVLVDNIEVKNIPKQSEVAMPTIINILKKNELKISNINEIIVVNGPGSFTGVRIGVTIAKTLAYMNDINIKEISMFDILKYTSKKNSIIIAVSEKNGKYIGVYEKDKLIDDYFYLKNSEFTEYASNKEVFPSDQIDLNLIPEISKNINYINAHNIKPIYVKDVETGK